MRWGLAVSWLECVVREIEQTCNHCAQQGASTDGWVASDGRADKPHASLDTVSPSRDFIITLNLLPGIPYLRGVFSSEE
jgi:hypothetical protein